VRWAGRALAAALVLCLAPPAAGYLLPVQGVLKRMAQRREELALRSLEARGTFALRGEAARAAAAATGLALTGPELVAPALVTIKIPGRCRLELTPAELAESERPAVVWKQGRIAGARGLDRVPAAAVLAETLCVLLGQRAGGAEPDRPYAEALARLGVALGEVHLGRSEGRIAYVLGARPSERKPQAWVDKATFQPARLIYARGGRPLAEVRLLDFGSPMGGDWFPRAAEVHGAGGLEARFSTEKVVANPKVADSLF